MAFTETTSYVEVADADTYFTARLHGNEWFGFTPDERTAALVAATSDIDQLVFKGDPTDADQVNKWPRDGSATVPEAIEKATCEIAFERLLGRDPQQEMEALGVSGTGAGTTRQQFARGEVPPAPHLANGIVSFIAWRHLRPHLLNRPTFEINPLD